MKRPFLTIAIPKTPLRLIASHLKRIADALERAYPAQEWKPEDLKEPVYGHYDPAEDARQEREEEERKMSLKYQRYIQEQRRAERQVK